MCRLTERRWVMKIAVRTDNQLKHWLHRQSSFNLITLRVWRVLCVVPEIFKSTDGVYQYRKWQLTRPSAQREQTAEETAFCCEDILRKTQQILK